MGWTCEDGSRVLGCAPTKFSQCWNPALEKVARMMLADPVRTLADITQAVDDARQTQFSAELPTREAMLIGRADRPARRD